MYVYLKSYFYIRSRIHNICELNNQLSSQKVIKASINNKYILSVLIITLEYVFSKDIFRNICLKDENQLLIRKLNLKTKIKLTTQSYYYI